MEYEELLEQSNLKVLLHGKSARGKTYDAARVGLEVSGEGHSVLYLDTESEGVTTMVNLIESGDYEESDVENIEYNQVEDLGDLMDYLEPTTMENYDLVVIDTLDHKHTYALKAVTDAKRSQDADWQEYAAIYAQEKEVMERIGDPNCHILCTLDPESGKGDKAKGVQTNINGYFSIVIKKKKTVDGWAGEIENWVGRSDLMGSQTDNPYKGVTDAILERL
jgi:hypothetical protein